MELLDKDLTLFNGFDIIDEHPIFYKSLESKPTDFYVIHAHTPEHFTLLRYIDVGGIVTTHFSTITDKHELEDIVIKGMYKHNKLKLITRKDYLQFKDVYDNYIKSIDV